MSAKMYDFPEGFELVSEAMSTSGKRYVIKNMSSRPVTFAPSPGMVGHEIAPGECYLLQDIELERYLRREEQEFTEQTENSRCREWLMKWWPGSKTQVVQIDTVKFAKLLGHENSRVVGFTFADHFHNAWVEIGTVPDNQDVKRSVGIDEKREVE